MAGAGAKRERRWETSCCSDCLPLHLSLTRDTWLCSCRGLVAALTRGSRSGGTESSESWNPPAVWLEEPVRVKSTQRVEASAVSRIGSVEGLQVEKTWVSSVLMVRVWEQAGGRAR